jgi:protein-S-isoprenylcysteine O-methyltransferase Ste14
MADQLDRANAVVRPPIALLAAFLASLLVDWLYPLKLLPASVPTLLLGGFIFIDGLALAVWAITTIRRAGTRVETTQPTTTIVADGPYRFSRNPIYLAMGLGLVGLAIGFNTVWILVALAAFYLVVRYGVIAREEAYLERKFGALYLDYKSRVRRWL